jgi:hypothetical protein
VDDAAEVQVLRARAGLERHAARLGHLREAHAEQDEQRVVRVLAGQHGADVLHARAVERRRRSGKRHRAILWTAGRRPVKLLGCRHAGGTDVRPGPRRLARRVGLERARAAAGGADGRGRPAQRRGPCRGLGDLEADTAEVRRAVDAVDGPVVLVAHSYGGLPVTAAAVGAPNVAHIAYVTAFLLDEGDTLLGLFGGSEPDWFIPGDEGATVFPDRPEEVFYNDCPPDVAAAATRRLVPHARSVFTDALHGTAWRDVPTSLRGLRAGQRDPGLRAGRDGRPRRDGAPPRQRALAVPVAPGRGRRAAARRAA